jgi:hypothetical protein
VKAEIGNRKSEVRRQNSDRYSPFRFLTSDFRHLTCFSLFALFIASPAAAVECAPYCDYTHDYGPYDLSWKRPGLYAFPLCAPNGECAPRAAHVYSPVSGWPYYGPYRGVRITVRPRRNR